MSRKLTIEELNYVQNEVKLKGKKLGVAYVLALLFGFLGVHLGYLEKTRTALMRALLTILVIASYFPVQAAVIASETNGITTQLQQYSSTLFVVYMVLLSINVILMMYDLIKLPSMVSKVNEKIESKMSTRVIEASNVEGQIREDETSDRLVDKISEKLKSEIESKSKMIEEEMIVVQNNLMRKNETTADLIENINMKIKEFENLSIDLDEKIESFKKKHSEEIENLKADSEKINLEIKEKIEEVKTNLGSQMSNISEVKDNHTLNGVESINNEPINKFKNELEKTFKVNSEVSHDSNSKKTVEKLIEKKDINFQFNIQGEKEEDASEELSTINELTSEEINFKSKVVNEESNEVEKSKDKFKDNTPSFKKDSLDEKDTLYDKNYMTIKETLEKGKGKVSVKGFIVGYMSPIKHRITFDNFDGDMNISIADNPKEKDSDKMITVQLSWDSKLREHIGLSSNPDNLGKQVAVVNGELSKYFKGLGLKKVDSIILIDSKEEFMSKD